MDYNYVSLIGNLGKEPELKKFDSGKQCLNFSLATNYRWKDAAGEIKTSVEFHSIVVWGKLGDFCYKYLDKGSKVFVQGKLRYRSWEDTKNKQKKIFAEIVAEQVILLDKKKEAVDSEALDPVIEQIID